MHVGDARNLEHYLPTDLTLDLTISSPPYWNAVDYGVPGQIGFGQADQEYLEDMTRILDSLYLHTADTGSLWLVVDTIKQSTSRGIGRLVPLPFQLAERAESVGWVLHDVIVWRKDRTLPWSHKGQLRNGFEYVLFLVKSRDFKFRLDRVRSHDGLASWWKRYPERYSPLGAAPTNVWDFPIPVQGSWSNGMMRHQCPLPVGLVQRIVELCSDQGDIVCDPFAGVGTVPAVAAALGRRIVGIDLVPANVEQFYSSVLPETLTALAPSEVVRKTNEAFGLTIARLRHAKLPRVVGRRLRERGIPFVGITSVATVTMPRVEAPFSVGANVLTVFASEDSRGEAEEEVRALLLKPPLSKFGIAVELVVADAEEWSAPTSPAGWSRVQLENRSPTPVPAGLVPSVADPVVLVSIPTGDLIESTELQP
jgi:DNA modification methylase